ncbi:MAG: hypothetical protein IJI03_12440 [Rudaea sp.]|nr:hypothetical protein [Rudaea sp.]
MSNVRTLPAPIMTADAINNARALLEIRIALFGLMPVAMSWQNHSSLTMEQRLADYSWRLGFVTSGLERLNQILAVLDTSITAGAAAAPKEKADA